MKTYSNKSNATRAMNTYVKKVQANLIEAEVLPVSDGFIVAFKLDSKVEEQVVEMLSDKFEVQVAQEKAKEVVPGFTHCPSCEISLENGVSDYDAQLDIAQKQDAPEAAIEKEFVCLTCDHQFGKVVKPVKKAKAETTGKGIKIDKAREERNGVKRPSAGGKCAQLWDLFDLMYQETGMVPTPKPAKQRSAEQGLDGTTTQVQLYRWREFMGFKR